MPLTPQGTLPFKHVDQVDNPTPGTYTPTELKVALDSTPEDLKTTINNMITILLGTTTSDSGAHNIGSQAISGVSGATVYAQLVALKALLDSLVIDQIPDGSLTNIKLATDIRVGSLASLTTTDKTSVVAAVNEHLAETSIDDVHGLLTGGKIIEESGNNANGYYIRFSDGTQICNHRQTGTTDAGNSNFTWVFPASFVASSIPDVFVTDATGGARFHPIDAATPPGSISAIIRTRDASGVLVLSGAYTVSLFSIGRRK